MFPVFLYIIMYYINLYNETKPRVINYHKQQIQTVHLYCPINSTSVLKNAFKQL